MKLISFGEINERIRSYSYGYLHRKSLPKAPIFKDKLSFSASESWCWILRFPFIFGDLISEQLNDLLGRYYIITKNFAKELYLTQINKLETIIEKFVSLVVNVNIFKLKIISKLHFLTHYPNILGHYSTMRYESKHKYFKNIINNAKNYHNLCKTLATRHQQYFVTLLEQPIKYNVTLGKLKEIFIELLAVFEDITNISQLHNHTTTYVNCISIHYRPGIFIETKENSKILIIIFMKSNIVIYFISFSLIICHIPYLK